MAFDVYVGSLTRYIVGNWENPGKRYAREHGIEYNIIRPRAKPEDAVTDPQVIQEAVVLWRQSLEIGLKSNLPGGLPWDEGFDSPYFTERPNWEGYTSLLLHAAHVKQPQFPRPAEPDPDYEQNETYLTATAAESTSPLVQLLTAEIWLPNDFDFTFKFEDVIGNQVVFGSSVSLLKELKELTVESYEGSETDPAKWKYPESGNDNPFEQAARVGLEIFQHLAEMSVQHRLPMKLDY